MKNNQQLTLGSVHLVLAGIALALGFVQPALAGVDKPVVAVFRIEDKTKQLKPATVDALTEMLANGLGKEGVLRIVPPGEVRRAILEKQKDSYKECYDQACQIELGREVAATKTLSMSITRLEDLCVVSAAVYDLKLAASDTAASAAGGCSARDLMAAVQGVAAEIRAYYQGPRSATPAPAKIIPPVQTPVQTPPPASVKPAPLASSAANNDMDADGVPDALDKCPQSPENMNGFEDNDGCPDVGFVEEKDGRLILQQPLAFKTNSAEVRSDHPNDPHFVVKQLANYLQAFPSLHIEVQVHSDSMGNNSYNLQLTQKRAQAVLDLLVANGISPSRIQAKGYGEDRPIRSNQTREGRAANRRVEIWIKAR